MVGVTNVDGTTELSGLGALVWILSLLAWCSVFVRRRFPLVPFVLGALQALTGLDCALLLVGAFAVIVSATRRWAVTCAVSTAVLLAFAVIRDSLRDPGSTGIGNVLYGFTPGTGEHSEVAVTAVLFACLGYALAVGGAYLLRASRSEHAAYRIARRARARTAELDAELTRRAERDRLAREIHDALAHRLSLISLQSGALEMGSAGTDPVTAQAASQLRLQAHASLQDLRGLLGDLSAQDDATPESARPPAQASLRTIPELVRSVRATGARVDAVVLVDGAQDVADAVGHSAYRIAQEALTNAVKHAPGAPIDLYVAGSAAQGIRVRVANPLLSAPAVEGSAGAGSADAGAGARADADAAAVPGSGAGLRGMHERARLLGGQVWIGAYAGQFIVDAQLPWAAAKTGR